MFFRATAPPYIVFFIFRENVFLKFKMERKLERLSHPSQNHFRICIIERWSYVSRYSKVVGRLQDSC